MAVGTLEHMDIVDPEQNEVLKGTPVPPETRRVIYPGFGEQITSLATGNTYRIGDRIGERNFGVAYHCKDVWDNSLAAKVLKPIGSYDRVRQAAEAEFVKLITLRHPNITYVSMPFNSGTPFTSSPSSATLRYHSSSPLTSSTGRFNGPLWLMPIARCLLQAVHFLHLSNYAHQDIHPGNVLVAFTRDEMDSSTAGSMVFKLADLGVSKLLGEMAHEGARGFVAAFGDRTFDGSGEVVGKPDIVLFCGHSLTCLPSQALYTGRYLHHSISRT